MKNLNNRIAFLLLMVAGMFGVQNAVADTAIPLSVGDYLVTSTSETTGTINNNDGGNLGGIYKDATATFTLTNTSAQNMVLTFLTGNNNNSNPRVNVTMNDGTQDFFTETVDVENTGGWTPVTMHVFDVGEVPAGTIKLKFTFTNTSSYVCNLGSIGLYNKTAYLATLDAMPGDIDLNKGTYSGGARWNYNNNGKVGWLSNGTSAYYPSLYVSNAGKATLNIGMTYNGDGTINVKIIDLSTGETEIDENLTITSDKCQGLTTPTSFELDHITAGYKSMKLTMSTAASYLIDYQDLSLSIASWTPIDIDLRSGQLGTSGNNLQKYLTIDGETYNYADDEPAKYNALLSASSFNGNQHGYVGLTANIPVEAGIYKLTVGTCQYNNGALAIKNSSDVAQTIYDEDGQSHTSFSAGGTCDNSTVGSQLYHTSIWYQAENDETIKVVFDTYTPYFQFEKVDAVPELRYTYTFVNDTEGATGTVPASGSVADGESITIPVNQTLYKEGYTLTGWNDGTTTHAIGSTFTPTDNTTLTAVFTANTYSVDQSLAEITVRWDFQRKNGTPTVQWEGRTGDFLVTQTTVNGNTIDVKLGIDTNPGKFNNSSWNDWCQVNEGTTFTFPSKNGTTVSAFSMNEPKNGSDVKSTLDGNDYESYSSNVASYSTTNTSGTSTLIVKGGSYYRYIDVTYPANDEDLLVKSVTVDGVAAGGDILAPINFNNPHTATLSGNVYTTEPTVKFTLADDSQVTAVMSGTGTSRTYTVETTINETDYTFTLTVEGIHTYTKGLAEETVNLKYSSEQVSDNVWSNGVYSLSPVGDGWNNSGFKLNKNNNPFTLTVPSDVQVKQFIIHEFKDNYTEGAFNTITSEGMTTAYIPTKHNLPNTDGEKYNLIINLADHQAGEPVVFSFTGGSQITGWYELTIAHSDPGTAPVKTAQSVTIENNHAVVAVTFDREIPGDVEATINETTVTAEGGASTLYFPVWDLSYSTNYTLTIAAGAVEDAYGNSNASAIEIAVNVPAKASVAAATYDYVVSTADELKDAITAVTATNNSSSAARKTIFLKNGDYNLGSSESTVQWVNAHNVSFIGESRDGVVIRGTSSGISNPVLNLRYGSGFYLQDLTVKNDFDYGTGSFNGVAVAIYGGDKTIMKNVRMLSNQDTQVTGHRAYFEDCQIHGTVDFICGGGDNFYYHTDLVLENRGGNVITAPSTSSSTKWGYVFQECTIKAVDATAATTNAGSYYLGRPWQNEPRAYYLNTTMEVLPATAGWTSMGNLPTHFYEYNSMNGSSEALDLSDRTNSPSSTNTYDPVLTSEEAAKFTLKNVLGGTDSWLPTDYTTVMDAPAVTASGSTISWTAIDDARCYVIFKDGEYLTNQTETSYDISAAGVYTVRAANEMGGLGETSDEMAFISKTITSAGWATLCSPYALDFSGTGLTAYIVTGTVGETTELDVESVDDVPATTGVLLEGNAGVYYIPVIASSATDVDDNKLEGVLVNTLKDANTIYVLMNETAGVGFYKNNKQFTVGANTAYLPADFAGGSGSARSAYFFRGEITGVANVEAAAAVQKDGKFFKDGKLFIFKNGKKYNANGAQVK